ncbi:MAG: ribosomal protein S18-alanine N-acetyltransferase [Polyangiaceae bacterium]
MTTGPRDPAHDPKADLERARPRTELVVEAQEPLLEELTRLAEEAFPGQPFSMREEVARPWTRLWVAYDDDRPVCFLVGWHVADELHILNVATAVRAKRRGFASAVIEEILAYASEHRLRIVLLEVRASNEPAIALYRKHGFTVLGVRKAYYADNDEDAVEMVVCLDPATGQVQNVPF